ncbi:hypothetical protein [Natroniella acetigena]|nr:hypothetical protein [Natroniella acetigena]
MPRKFDPAQAFKVARRLKKEGKDDTEGYKKIMARLKDYLAK